MKKLLIALMIISTLLLSGCQKEKKTKPQTTIPSGQIVQSEKLTTEEQTITETAATPETPTGKKVVYEEVDSFDPTHRLFVQNVTKDGSKYILQGLEFELYTMSQEELDLMSEAGEVVLDDTIYKLEKPEKNNAVYILTEEGKENPLFSIWANNENRYENDYYLSRHGRYQECFRSTGKHIQVTLDNDVSCFDDYTDGIYTPRDVFSKFEYGTLLDNDTFPVPSFKISMSNGRVYQITGYYSK